MKINAARPRLIIALCLSLVFLNASGQVTFLVDNFSKDYFGKLFIKDTSEVFSPGWVAVYDSKTKKQLIKVESEELTFELHDGKPVANIKQLPYGEQSQIMYEDYNFDGKKDFAIMDGQNSCYHGPSFQIYLATAKGFEFSEPFTQLAQEYCGMFNVDHKEKKLYTMTKDGCCWHQFSEYVVKNNVPVAVKIVEEGVNAAGVAFDYTEKNLVNGKMVGTNYSMLAAEEIKDSVLFSFEFVNKKKVRLFTFNGHLYYAFTDKEDKIELLYDGQFHYSRKDNALWFKNEKVTYRITGNGLSAITPKGTFDMKAVGTSVQGSIQRIMSSNPDNLLQE
ncbi:MAG: hypothetical protein QM640_13400 [Niabella sp.]